MKKCKLSQALAVVVKRRRIAKGFSQEFLAERANLHTTYIGMIERKLRNPTVDVVAAIAKALGATVSEMMKEAENLHD